ncbi:MAG: TniQ family protein [Terracidiphilus sp.]
MAGKALWTENFRPRPGECVASIAVRLAPHGRLTPAELVRFGLKFARTPLAVVPTSIDSIGRLARLAGLQTAELAAAAWIKTPGGYRILGREVPVAWVETSRRRVAPGVLARDGGEPFVRTLWQIAALACDPESGEALRSRCWKCAHALTWQTANAICECPCGADQRAAPARRVPQDVLVAAREIAGLFGHGPKPKVPAPFDKLPDPALFRLLGWFGYFSDLREGAQLRPSETNAAKGYGALKRWPASFDEVVVATLRDHVERAEAASHSLRTRTMGRLMVVIGRAGSPAAITILRERAERVLGVSCDVNPVLQRIYGPPHREEYKRTAPQIRQPCFSSTGASVAMRPSHDRIKSRARWSS